MHADDVPDDKGIIFILAFKHPEFTEDPIHIEWITSHFVSEGTRCLLRGDVRSARGNAYFAYYFKHMKLRHRRKNANDELEQTRYVIKSGLTHALQLLS